MSLCTVMVLSSPLFAIGVVVFLRSVLFFFRWIVSYTRPRIDITSTFNTKWALVTGASAGLGHHISVRLATQGINMIGVGRNTDGLDSTQCLVKSLGAEFVPVVADLTRSSNEISTSRYHMTKYSFFTQRLTTGFHKSSVVSIGIWSLPSIPCQNILSVSQQRLLDGQCSCFFEHNPMQDPCLHTRSSRNTPHFPLETLKWTL
jgi:hypothetical protein